MKSIYYQFVNFIQRMPVMWFVIIIMLMFASTLVLVMKFFKIYNGTQKSFEKVSLIILALILFALMIYLMTIRN